MNHNTRHPFSIFSIVARAILLLAPALVQFDFTPASASAPHAGAWTPPVPASLNLTVRETAGVARANEVVRSGMPLPRMLNLRDPNALTLVDSHGVPVPAEFEVLARWNAGRSASAPIQWLLVTFAATVPANGVATFRLVTDGSAGPNPAPATQINITQNGNDITVSTG
ncbi:MAG: hypothetical protein KGJ80_10540, partial [Chloroflexota bacterium]|nr:hypothetical protein [Chloroflexota bacterium]